MAQIDDLSLDVDIHKFNDSFQVELRHDDPSNQAKLAPLRGEASFDPDELKQLESDPKAYGKELARQLFDKDQQLARRFTEVETAARLKGARLRLSLRIDGSAKELRALRWELLAHPTTGECLTTSETLLMSRFMASSDWRSVQLGMKEELSALIVVSAPTNLERMRLAPVDFVAEKRTIERILTENGVMLSVLGGPASPVTVETLIKSLRGTDIVYLVSHGTFSRKDKTAALVLQDENGEAKIVKVDELTRRIRELERPPRLVVVASCQSAGDGEPLLLGQGSTLATSLAEWGVPAVVAMQGLISMKTVEEMMPTFFRELLRDGRIDRALAVARGHVRHHHDAWMPALFMRINDGRLWSEPAVTSSLERIGLAVEAAVTESLERVELRQASEVTPLDTSRKHPMARPGWPLAVGVVALAVSLILTLATLLGSLWGRPVPGPTPLGASIQPAAPAPASAPATAPASMEFTPPTSPPVDLVEGGPSGRPWTSTSTGMHFIALEPAVFEMGSPIEEPGHTDGEQKHIVKLSQGFFIGDTEVTQSQWTKLMGSNPSLCEFGCDDDLPVQNITWCDALRFVNEMSKADGFAPAYSIPATCEQGGEVEWDVTVDSYRLPTEAEWEYAARAGTTTAYSFGADESSICTFTNLGDHSASKKLSGHQFAACNDKYVYAAPVTAFPPNAWGLHGVHGNVWEWVWDRYGDYPKEPVVDPIGPPTGNERCLRGGSFINAIVDIRSAKRHWDPPSFKLNRIGLRPVRGRGPGGLNAPSGEPQPAPL